ncbi:MAG: hypothetical protein WD673_01395 [Alphaproteobacteria bacterium]
MLESVGDRSGDPVNIAGFPSVIVNRLVVRRVSRWLNGGGGKASHPIYGELREPMPNRMDLLLAQPFEPIQWQEQLKRMTGWYRTAHQLVEPLQETSELSSGPYEALDGLYQSVLDCEPDIPDIRANIDRSGRAFCQIREYDTFPFSAGLRFNQPKHGFAAAILFDSQFTSQGTTVR